jgi:hypothetical protein
MDHEEIRDVTAVPLEVQVMRMLCGISRDLHKLRKEVRQLAQNDAALTAVVVSLAAAYSADFAALEAQITALTNAQQNEDDPAEDAAIASLQALVTTMQTNTAAANAAVAALNPPPAASTTGDSTTAPAATS